MTGDVTKRILNRDKEMEQNIFDYLVEGLDLNAFYSFIDSKTDIDILYQSDGSFDTFIALPHR